MAKKKIADITEDVDTLELIKILAEWMSKSAIYLVNINESNTICQELFYQLG